jgi:uncharacterized protein with HEPN domain
MEKALQHIKNECDFIISITKDKSREELIHDPLLSRATIWSLEIISEASKEIEIELSGNFPNVDWKNISGMNENLFHDSLEIDYGIVCDVLYNDVPELRQNLL